MAASKGFISHIYMAACEWFLMLLMFIDAALAFVLTKFARHYHLQSPCFFCSKLFHDPGSYLTLFCTHHRAQVSSLISCNLHDTLADVREMCDDCFASVTKYPKSPNLLREPANSGLCSCCNRQWRSKPKPSGRRSVQPGGIRLGPPKVTMKPPMPRAAGRGRGRGRFRRRNTFKRTRDRISGHSTPCHFENGMEVDVEMDTLSDSGYAELRFNSDSDNEVMFETVAVPRGGGRRSDDGSSVAHGSRRSQCRTRQDHSGPQPSVLISNGSIGHEPEEPNHVELHDRADHERSLSVDQVNGNDIQEVASDIGEAGSDQDLHSFKSEPSSSDEEDGFKSPGASSVSEIEGESVAEKLKRQVEYDREQLRLLHRELEEERNAAAIAADEAMAMITRLQEEKAALHTEALQYLRMMDEQAEYDMEALDKANDLLAEKDKDIQDLEAELEYWRSRYEDELHPKSAKAPVLDLENEKRYISECVSELEQKFHQVTSISNGDIHGERTESDHKDSSTSNGLTKKDVGALENEIWELNERLEALEADRGFLEHACNTVQTSEGLEFIKEIAHHLRDLRRARFDRRP